MGRRVRVDRSLEQKSEIVLDGMKSGNIAETCRRYQITANLYYRWKDEALQGATGVLGGRSAPVVEDEKDRRLRQLERSLGPETLEIEIPKIQDRVTVTLYAFRHLHKARSRTVVD